MAAQSSSNIDIWRHSNGHISVLCNATVTWLGLQVDLHVLCMLMWPWPNPRSRSRSRTIWTSYNVHFQVYLLRHPLSRGAQNWWLILTVWDLVYSFWEANFRNFLLGEVSLEFKLHRLSIFRDIQMATYFGTGWCYSHMVGYAGSPTYTAYVHSFIHFNKQQRAKRPLICCYNTYKIQYNTEKN